MKSWKEELVRGISQLFWTSLVKMSCWIAIAHSNTTAFQHLGFGHLSISSWIINTTPNKAHSIYTATYTDREMSDSSCHSLALPTLMRYHQHVNSFRDAALKRKNTMQINRGNYSMFHHQHWCITMLDNHDHNADERHYNGIWSIVYCECCTCSTMNWVFKRQITPRKVIHWKLIQVQN